jgi:enoyl-CoA hydratase/carnithine racemase
VEYKNIFVEKKDEIARVILNRPEVRNALTPADIKTLIATLKDIDRDNHIRVVFIKGAGQDFCTGMDLDYVLGVLERNPEEYYELFPLGPELEETIENMSKPVIAAVQGNAIAGGFIFAYFCDLIIATEDARFGDTHAVWGLIPGWQEPQRLARSIGTRKAKQLFLTCDILSAKEAQEMDLVYKVYPVGQLDKAIDDLALKFIRLSRLSLHGIKRQFAWNNKTDWHTTVEIDKIIRKGTPWITASSFSDDAKEKLHRFLEKKAKKGV